MQDAIEIPWKIKFIEDDETEKHLECYATVGNFSAALGYDYVDGWYWDVRYVVNKKIQLRCVVDSGHVKGTSFLEARTEVEAILRFLASCGDPKNA